MPTAQCSACQRSASYGEPNKKGKVHPDEVAGPFRWWCIEGQWICPYCGPGMELEQNGVKANVMSLTDFCELVGDRLKELSGKVSAAELELAEEQGLRESAEDTIDSLERDLLKYREDDRPGAPVGKAYLVLERLERLVDLTVTDMIRAFEIKSDLDLAGHLTESMARLRVRWTGKDS